MNKEQQLYLLNRYKETTLTLFNTDKTLLDAKLQLKRIDEFKYKQLLNELTTNLNLTLIAIQDDINKL